ncbi:MAG: hypothetical protein GEU75_09375 [Dehalococcoidia bacterium]|nr:hypothetical protein [Dehalococcoidia bacterium]
MVLIYHTSGDCTEIEAAVRAHVQDGKLLCFDRRGQVVATFLASNVQTYTADPVLVEAIEDEACDDVVTIQSDDQSPKQPALDS